MMICKDCEYRGYSPEFCAIHAKHCIKKEEKRKKGQKVIDDKKVAKGLKAALYTSAGVIGAAVGIAAVPVLGFHAITHTLALKISGGVFGGGYGLFKGENKKNKENKNIKEENNKTKN